MFFKSVGVFFFHVYFPLVLLILGFTGFIVTYFFNVRFIAWMGIRLHTFTSLLGLLGDSIQIQIYQTRQDCTYTIA